MLPRLRNAMPQLNSVFLAHAASMPIAHLRAAFPGVDGGLRAGCSGSDVEFAAPAL